jgi:PLP dependent protein
MSEPGDQSADESADESGEIALRPEDFSHNLRVIVERIAEAGGDPQRVKIVAVSKGQPANSIRAALHAGHGLFGENYADELVTKASVDYGDFQPTWHFQGRLQSNKINRLKPFVSVWQTLDSVERADALGSRVPGATVLVQVDSTAGTGQRAGALIGDVPTIVDHARSKGLEVAGLMTVAPLFEDSTHAEQAANRAFSALSALAHELGLVECSMGMSGDLEQAIRAGSTMVRIGAALFGPRR